MKTFKFTKILVLLVFLLPFIAITQLVSCGNQITQTNISTISDSDLSGIKEITFEASNPENVTALEIEQLENNETLLSQILSVLRSQNKYVEETDFYLKVIIPETINFSSAQPVQIKIIPTQISRTLFGEKTFSLSVRATRVRGLVTNAVMANFSSTPFLFVPNDPTNVNDGELAYAITTFQIKEAVTAYLDEYFENKVQWINVQYGIDYTISNPVLSNPSDRSFVVSPTVGRPVQVSLVIPEGSEYLKSNGSITFELSLYAASQTFDLNTISCSEVLTQTITVADVKKITYNEWINYFNLNSIEIATFALKQINIYAEWITINDINIENNDFISGDRNDATTFDLDVVPSISGQSVLINKFKIQVLINTHGADVNIARIHDWWNGWDCDQLPVIEGTIEPSVDLSSVDNATVAKMFRDSSNSVLVHALQLIQGSTYDIGSDATPTIIPISISLTSNDIEIQMNEPTAYFNFDTAPNNTLKIRFQINSQQNGATVGKQSVTGTIYAPSTDDSTHSTYVNIHIVKKTLNLRWETMVNWFANKNSSSTNVVPLDLKFDDIRWDGRGHDSHITHDDYHTNRSDPGSNTVSASIYAYKAKLDYDPNDLTTAKMVEKGINENGIYTYDTSSTASANDKKFIDFMDNVLHANVSCGPSNYVNPRTGATYVSKITDIKCLTGNNSTKIRWNGWFQRQSVGVDTDDWNNVTMRPMWWSRYNPDTMQNESVWYQRFEDNSITTPDAKTFIIKFKDRSEKAYGLYSYNPVYGQNDQKYKGFYMGNDVVTRPPSHGGEAEVISVSGFTYYYLGQITGAYDKNEYVHYGDNDGSRNNLVDDSTKYYTGDSGNSTASPVNPSALCFDTDYFKPSDLTSGGSRGYQAIFDSPLMDHEADIPYTTPSSFPSAKTQDWIYQNYLPINHTGAGTWWAWGLASYRTTKSPYFDDNSRYYYTTPWESKDDTEYNGGGTQATLGYIAPWRISTNIARNLQFQVIPRDTSSGKTPGIYITVSPGNNYDTTPHYTMNIYNGIDISETGWANPDNGKDYCEQTWWKKDSSNYWSSWYSNGFCPGFLRERADLNHSASNYMIMGSVYAYSMNTPLS